MNNEAKIGKARCPVYITHCSADPVIPFRQGERLYEAAREPHWFLRIPGMGQMHLGGAEFVCDWRLRRLFHRTGLLFNRVLSLVGGGNKTNALPR